MKGSFRKKGCKCPKVKDSKVKKCLPSCKATWSYRITVKDPLTNKRIWKSDFGFITRREAEVSCAEMITNYEKGILSAASKKETLGAFMIDFLDTVLINDVEASTLENKKAIMNNHVIPVLGSTKLQKLTPMQIQKFINKLIDEELNAGTIQNIMRLVNQTLEKALEWGYVVKNVASLTSKPSYKPEIFEVWTRPQCEQFLESSKGSRFFPYYLIMNFSGIRPGECAALSWDRVDLKNNTIRIDRNVVWTKEKGIHIKESPKNDASRRTITIAESVMNYLRKYKLAQEPNELNLVTSGIKNPIAYNSVLNKIFAEDVTKTDLPKIRLHDIRHSFATYLLSPKPFGLNQSIVAVSKLLGHAKTTTTMNTYAHVLPNMQESLADQVNNAMSITI